MTKFLSPVHQNDEFDEHENFYTIKLEFVDHQIHYRIIYGHFYDDKNFFLYKTTNKIDEKFCRINTNLHRCPITELYKPKNDHYYLFTDYEDIYRTSIIVFGELLMTL